MESLNLMAAGFAQIMNLPCILLIILGVAVGIIFGAIPGLSATIAIALFLPMTFGMPPIWGFSLLVGLYIGGISGGLISAILLRIPGTPSSVATCFDGHPMAEKGQAGRALGAGILYSFIGGLFSFLILIFIAPPVAEVAIKFGPFEYFSVAIFSITMIASLVSGSVLKGIISALIGIVFAMVGGAPIDSADRFTFGIKSMSTGFDILPVLIGLFAISEIIKTAETGLGAKKDEVRDYKVKGFGISFSEFKEQFVNMIRSTAIGIGIGILPGIGGGTSNLLSYAAAKNNSKYSEKFGTGILDGIVASETANNASIGGALVPLLTLGIPGDTVTAMLLGGFMIHGISPGPLLLETQPKLVYGIFAALLIANITMILLEFFGLRVFVKLLNIPKYILLPVILAICVVGAYGTSNRMFDVVTIFIFGIIGYGLEKFGFPIPPIILGFILSPMIETNLMRGLMISQGSFFPFLTKPISAAFLIISVISVILAVRKQLRNSRAESAVSNS